jgi:hypothetical protein
MRNLALTVLGPQVKCNRTVEEIAVARAGRRQKRYSAPTSVWSSG